ncbi:PIG-L deacetylase family protein [Pseudalkalibacillus caeni]|uniref:PIG-L family deacetylase n=1 Tax=Exobacillus caeni TaxID=2574798 RepID=A0A5R9F561_9BACL|nr:PIG-L family deacetylase [Pseudalkalibacillus caeni]TLS35614.1 PIG-L family deacetylase [Pseudalkalibacillus caeni]
MKTILFVFAHPDDETFTVGGTLTEFAEMQDVQTIVYSATPGDAGKCGNPPICTKEELADVRTDEFKKATGILGVDHAIIGKFQDGKLTSIPVEEIAGEVSKLIAEFHPEVVVTFPPHGLSGHADHKAIQKATYQAVTGSTNKVEKLYYATFPESVAAKNGNPPFSDPDENISVAKSFSQQQMDTVRKALLAHRTQHLSVERVFKNLDKKPFNKFNNKEYYVLAWSREGITDSSTLI